MNTVVIYMSIHHQNTEKVAREIAEPLDAHLATPLDFSSGISDYDLVGVGSGIYYAKHHESLLELVKDLPPVNKKNAFIFSTRGMGPVWVYHRPLRDLLLKRGFAIIGEFSCKGYDSNGFLKHVGGINRGHPSEEDLRRARVFAQSLREE
ncbi:MAG: flavodoxin family protein [Theionarchaea archaeon]|nr:flavodoxin family protein [Theionarchaea archaeon]